MKKKSKILGFAGLAVAVFGLARPAAAVQIFVCQPSPTQPCTSAPGGTAIGHESNLITTTGAFDLGVSGSTTLQSPLLVGVAIPNTGTGTASISFGASHTNQPFATVGTYGLDHNTATLTSGNLWDALGLQGGGSISFNNFVSADQQNGFGTPTSYAVSVFAISTNLAAGSPITIDTGAGPGSFIFAFSCENGTGTNGAEGGCINPANGHLDNGNVGQTVFTNVGLISTVPEPASLAIFGASLAGLGVIRRRRRKV